MTDEEKKARLEAAAPDLLAALENLLEDYIWIGGAGSDRAGVVIEAKAALKKARGDIFEEMQEMIRETNEKIRNPDRMLSQ